MVVMALKTEKRLHVATKKNPVVNETLEPLIVRVRGQRVILDAIWRGCMA